MNLRGKRVLITGGSSGIGFALAEAMIAKGASVAITGRKPDGVAAALDKLRAEGGTAFAVVADVSTEQGRKDTLTRAVDALGGLDVLVNNAGVVRAGRLEDLSEQEIRAIIDTDLLAPILLTRAALPHLRKGGDSLIIDVASGIALVGVPFYATYAGAKAGLGRFSEALRRELNGEGIRVLTVYPMATDTPMMKSSNAGPELGFDMEPVSAVVEATIDGIEADAIEVVRGGEARAKRIALNREDPAALDARFLELKPALAEAVRDHSAL